MTGLRRLWRGELPLADAFWNWAVLGGLVVNLGTSGLFLAALAADRVILAFFVGYAVPLPYNLAVTVGVWRAAARYAGDRRWAELARAATITGMVLATLT